MKKISTKTLTFSAIVMAAYIALMYLTQSIAFLPQQMRVATALYATSYLFPFLIVPLALANSLSNTLMGGLGFFDIVGGFFVGLVTAGLVALPRKLRLPMWLVIPPIILAPALIVPLWLAPLMEMPYWAVVLGLGIGQTPPAILGYILIRALSKREIDALL